MPSSGDQPDRPPRKPMRTGSGGAQEESTSDRAAIRIRMMCRERNMASPLFFDVVHGFKALCASCRRLSNGKLVVSPFGKIRRRPVK